MSSCCVGYMCVLYCMPGIFVRTAGTRSAAGSTSQEPEASDQQPLSLAAAERANETPGLKQQRLINALWALDRIDQRTLPLDRTYTYGTPSTPGTGELCGMAHSKHVLESVTVPDHSLSGLHR